MSTMYITLWTRSAQHRVDLWTCFDEPWWGFLGSERTQSLHGVYLSKMVDLRQVSWQNVQTWMEGLKDSTQRLATAGLPLTDGIVDRTFRQLTPLVSPKAIVGKQLWRRHDHEQTFSMKVKIYFIALWNISSSTACAPMDKWDMIVWIVYGFWDVAFIVFDFVTLFLMHTKDLRQTFMDSNFITSKE